MAEKKNYTDRKIHYTQSVTAKQTCKLSAWAWVAGYILNMFYRPSRISPRNWMGSLYILDIVMTLWAHRPPIGPLRHELRQVRVVIFRKPITWWCLASQPCSVLWLQEVRNWRRGRFSRIRISPVLDIKFSTFLGHS